MSPVRRSLRSILPAITSKQQYCTGSFKAIARGVLGIKHPKYNFKKLAHRISIIRLFNSYRSRIISAADAFSGL